MRLGEGEFGGRSALTLEAMDRGVLVCRAFADLARAHGATESVAVATSATREAANQAAFVRRLRDEAGLDVHVVSGKEEARLIFLGLLSRVQLGAQQAIVVDIGGGSTEIAVGDADGPSYVESLRLGAIRLTSAFPEPAGGRARARQGVRADAPPRADRVRPRASCPGRRGPSTPPTGPRGRSATSPAPSSARCATRTPQREDTITRVELAKMAKLLRGLDLEERRRVPGLNPLRADIVVAGAAILEAVMEDLGLEEIRAVAECGLREGLMVDHLARVRGLGHGGTAVRERSVLQLARACSFDEAHARQVQALALELFDSASASGLHSFGRVRPRPVRARRPAARHRHVPQLHRPPPAQPLPHPQRRAAGLRRARGGGHGGYGALPPQVASRRAARGLRRPRPRLPGARAPAQRAPAARRVPGPRPLRRRDVTRRCTGTGRERLRSRSRRPPTGTWSAGAWRSAERRSRRRLRRTLRVLEV